MYVYLRLSVFGVHTIYCKCHFIMQDSHFPKRYFDDESLLSVENIRNKLEFQVNVTGAVTWNNAYQFLMQFSGSPAVYIMQITMFFYGGGESGRKINYVGGEEKLHKRGKTSPFRVAKFTTKCICS